MHSRFAYPDWVRRAEPKVAARVDNIVICAVRTRCASLQAGLAKAMGAGRRNLIGGADVARRTGIQNGAIDQRNGSRHVTGALETEQAASSTRPRPLPGGVSSAGITSVFVVMAERCDGSAPEEVAK